MEFNYVLAKMHNLLLRFEREDGHIKDCMIQLAVNFGYSIHIDTWKRMWVTVSNLHCIIIWKKTVIKWCITWFMTSEIIKKIYRCISNKCWKCGKHEETFYRAWWTSGKAKNFLIQIHMIMQTILKISILKKLE